jgi:hypothetical protein
VMYVVVLVVTSKFVHHRFTALDREHVIGPHTGNRKLRPLLDPFLVKTVSNEFGFEGTFAPSLQELLLLRILFGFSGTVYSVCQTAVTEIAGVANNSVQLNGLLACVVIATYFGGKLLFIFLYVLMDFEGCCIFMVALKVCLLVNCLVFGQDTRNCEPCFKDTREPERLNNPCWMKALYYALYLWPQGPISMLDITSFMVYSRHHWNITQSGFFQQRSFLGGIPLMMVYDVCFRVIHVPLIGRMFWLFVVVTNPLWTSMMMDLVNVYRQQENLCVYLHWFACYPLFAAMHMQVRDIPWLLAVCDSMRHLGSFMADARWPNMLLCGDPMYCWRSQYTYSHGLFYNIGGDGGNISYITWFLFCKSQKRQCCCPYRKLKADAPEKCCPPCCLGPYVEDSGGCTCPCCCASCAGRPNASDSQ